jgi:hypothetical protein
LIEQKCTLKNDTEPINRQRTQRANEKQTNNLSLQVLTN